MTGPKAEPRTRTEEFTIAGEHLLAKVKEIVHEGNTRRIIIKNQAGHSLIELPVTVGVVGAVLLPVWAAIAAIATLAAHYTVAVVKVDPPSA